MSITIRAMKTGEANAVAGFVAQLADDLKLGVTPRLTGEKLVDAANLVQVMVAEDQGRLQGACLWLLTFSTFRGVRGVYVVDLFVRGERRGQSIGKRLLNAVMREGAKLGAEFVKLEVDVTNVGGARFYEREGFLRKDDDRLFVLEPDKFKIATREE